MKRTGFEARIAKRRAVENAEKSGLVSDSQDTRMALLQKVKEGQLTLTQAQSELKRIKREGTKRGLLTRAQVFSKG